jgi:hypothetical protein
MSGLRHKFIEAHISKKLICRSLNTVNPAYPMFKQGKVTYFIQKMNNYNGKAC